MLMTLTWIICLGMAIPVAVLALECLVGALPSFRRNPGNNAPPYIVLMPAHDEAAGIAKSVTDVLAQLRACDRLVVVADNCTDNSGEIAERLGATVITRTDPALRGKSYALQFGRAYLEAEFRRHGDAAAVIIIVDADCSPEPRALGRLAATASRRNAIVQGAYLLSPPANATAIVQMSCFAFLVKNLVRQLALRRLAGAALLQGSGMAFPARIFMRIDWSPTSLVEDLDLGLRLVLAGDRVTFDDRAQFFSDASSQGGTAGQRRRWEHGMLQAMGTFVPRLALAALLGRPRLLFLALDQIIPPTVLLIMLAAVGTALSILLGGFALPVLILLLCDAALFLGLFLAWLAHGRSLLPAQSIVAGLKYIIWKLPIFVQFITRRQRQWIRTDRAP